MMNGVAQWWSMGLQRIGLDLRVDVTSDATDYISNAEQLP
jgi:hypothetical protein